MRGSLKDFFISYNNSDQYWAEWIAWQLEEAGYKTVLQAWDFRPGSNFVIEMDRATKEAKRTIVILSPHYLKAAFTQPEWAEAFRQDPKGELGLLLPVRVKECEVRGLLSQIIYIDLVGLDETKSREKLLAGVQHRRFKPTNPPRFPTKMQHSMIGKSQFPGSLPNIWTIPYRRNLLFTGRKDILERLHNALGEDNSSKLEYILSSLSKNGTSQEDDVLRNTENIPAKGNLAVLSQAISGLGGIGKTQIAVEYAYRYCDDYQAILWARADTHKELVSDFVSIAKELDIPEQGVQDQSQVVEAVKRWLRNQINWLFIFDNADDPTIIYDYLPEHISGKVLITTRAQSVGEQALSIEIDKMEPKEGSLFLLRRAKIISPESSLEDASKAIRIEAEAISELMDGLPLALDQAGAYIEETKCGLIRYRELYKQRQTDLLKRRGRSGITSSHPESVTTTFSLCFEKVQQNNHAAVELLQLCAFLYPDAIPLEIITEGASDLSPILQSIVSDPLELDKAIEELLKYSLVHRDSDTNMLAIHRLVQAVIKDGMKEDVQRQWAGLAVRAVNRTFPDVEFATWPYCQRYLLHAQACAMLIELWNMISLDAARLLSQSGVYLRVRAQYEDAEKFCIKALAIRKQIQGEEHNDVINSINDLALLHRAQGQYDQAEQLFKQTLAIQERSLGREHLEVAEILNNLGLLYYDQEKYSQGKQLHSRALEIWEKVLGPEHPNVARGLNNLAIFYNAQHEYNRAESLLIRALTIYEKAFAAHHPNVASILNNLGRLCYAQSKYTQAEDYYMRALKIYEQTLGSEHPSIAPILSNLAILYSDQSKYEQSESYYCRAIPIYEQTFGSEHLVTIERLQDLAEIYYVQDKYTQAEPIFNRVFAIYKKTKGQKHPDTITCHDRIAEIHNSWSAEASIESKQLPQKLQMLLDHGYWD
jgi:tetratricopeptide (TPR) repeat protein